MPLVAGDVGDILGPIVLGWKRSLGRPPPRGGPDSWESLFLLSGLRGCSGAGLGVDLPSVSTVYVPWTRSV